MKQVWKYPLGIIDRQVVSMPMDAKILTLAIQYNTPCLWAEVDPEAPLEQRIFNFYGTGHEMPENPGTFIGTLIVANGTLVFHLYENRRGGIREN